MGIIEEMYTSLLGRMYDKYGNYGVQWWTNRSVEQYKSRSDCMVKQYSQFSYFGKNVSKLMPKIYKNPGEYIVFQVWNEFNLNQIAKQNEYSHSFSLYCYLWFTP